MGQIRKGPRDPDKVREVARPDQAECLRKTGFFLSAVEVTEGL